MVCYDFYRGHIGVTKANDEVELSDNETDWSDIGYKSLFEVTDDSDRDSEVCVVLLARNCLCEPVCATLFDFVRHDCVTSHVLFRVWRCI